MCASKIGYWAAASRGSPTRSRTAASETSEPRALIAVILSRGRSRDLGRSAHAAGTVADAPGVAQRGEDDAMLLGDALVVSAAAPADDSRRRATDEHRRGALGTPAAPGAPARRGGARAATSRPHLAPAGGARHRGRSPRCEIGRRAARAAPGYRRAPGEGGRARRAEEPRR